MSLAPKHLFAAVVPSLWSAGNAALGTLGIDHAASSFDVRSTLDFDPHASAQPVVQVGQDAALGPLLEVVMHRTLGRKRTRQQLPLATGLQLVEQGVEHGSQIDLSLWPALGFHLDRGTEQRPLFIRQVGVVGLALDSRLARCYHRFAPSCDCAVVFAPSTYHNEGV